VRVKFVEGAPKDRFIVTNEGTCSIGSAELVIDFRETTAGLIFDVSSAGAGVEVYQPFEVTQGADFLTNLPMISDGDQTANLSIATLGATQKIEFTIDVDDTAGARAITVSNDEMNGASVSLEVGGERVSASLGATKEALLKTASCTS
jgi:hypothetical protein